MGAKLIRDRLVMINFTCQLEWQHGAQNKLIPWGVSGLD